MCSPLASSTRGDHDPTVHLVYILFHLFLSYALYKCVRQNEKFSHSSFGSHVVDSRCAGNWPQNPKKIARRVCTQCVEMKVLHPIPTDLKITVGPPKLSGAPSDKSMPAQVFLDMGKGQNLTTEGCCNSGPNFKISALTSITPKAPSPASSPAPPTPSPAPSPSPSSSSSSSSPASCLKDLHHFLLPSAPIWHLLPPPKHGTGTCFRPKTCGSR